MASANFETVLHNLETMGEQAAWARVMVCFRGRELLDEGSEGMKWGEVQAVPLGVWHANELPDCVKAGLVGCQELIRSLDGQGAVDWQF